MNYSEVETKVREATNDEAWGPHGTAMQDIAQYTFTYEHFPEVMGMLWKRMFHDNKKSWRRVYKVRILLTLKAPITTAADDIHKYFFIVLQSKKDLMFQVNPLLGRGFT